MFGNLWLLLNDFQSRRCHGGEEGGFGQRGGGGTPSLAESPGVQAGTTACAYRRRRRIRRLGLVEAGSPFGSLKKIIELNDNKFLEKKERKKTYTQVLVAANPVEFGRRGATVGRSELTAARDDAGHVGLAGRRDNDI